MYLSLSLLIVSPFLFFVRDEVFRKWLRFAGIWFVLGSVPILMAPIRTHGFLPLTPTRSIVSFWVGALFVPSALAFLFFTSRKRGPEKGA